MTGSWLELDTEQLASMRAGFKADHELLGKNPMALDLTRGKPGPEQLALSDPLDGILGGDYFAADGTDTRNYGGLRGIPEARALGGRLLDLPADRVMAAGNSSLSLMYTVVDLCLRHGLWGDDRRWSRCEQPKTLCPVPGYDRHFTINAYLGVAMVNVPMLDTGPDMEAAEALAADDAAIKSIWCVPKYANPTGVIYDEATVRRIARLPRIAAADDFVVFWDNAYAVHDFTFPPAPLHSLYPEAERAGTTDHVVLFASTSKITFAGAGVGFLGGSESTLAALEKQLSVQTVGHDKVNQLRHCRFLEGRLLEHMAQHAELVRPKFEMVSRVLDEELSGTDIASWTDPAGGYFVSLTTLPGVAQRVIELAAEVGLKLTPAGATFPYGRDRDDSTIRIAPTFGTAPDVENAVRVLALCIKLASSEKLTQT